MIKTRNKNILKLIQYKKMKSTSNLVAILVAALTLFGVLSACGKSDNKPEETTKETTTQLAEAVSTPEPEPQSFDDFWLEFQEAVAKKDKNKILAMCEFPMSIAAMCDDKISQNDFLENYYNSLLDCKELKKLTKKNKYKFSKKAENVKTSIEIYFENDNAYFKEKDVYCLSISSDYLDSDGETEFESSASFYFALRTGKYKLIAVMQAG